MTVSRPAVLLLLQSVVAAPRIESRLRQFAEFARLPRAHSGHSAAATETRPVPTLRLWDTP